MTDTAPTSVPPQPHEFRVHWWRSAIPAAFAIVVFGMLAYRNGIWYAGPGLGLVLLICAANRRGLVISQEGIEWYILRRKWRYRTIPWHAVRDVRMTLFGLLPPIRLIVEHGRYELWIWGAPQPERQIDVEIWDRNYAGGEVLWGTIHQYWSPRDSGAGVAANNERTAAPGTSLPADNNRF